MITIPENEDNAERVVSNEFVRACAEGRHDDVLMMIEDGADVDQFDEGIKEDNWQCTDGNEPNSFMQNGIQMAIRNKDLKLLRILDWAGADFAFKVDSWIPDPENEGKNKKAKVTADLFDLAAYSGFLDGILYVVENKNYDFPQDKDQRGELLCTAIRSGDYELVKFLVEEKHFDVHYIGERNTRPLTQAVDREVDSRILELILSKGVNPNYDSAVTAKYTITYAQGFKDDIDEHMGGFSRFERMSQLMDKHRNTPLSSAVFNAILEAKYDNDDEYDDYDPKRAVNALEKVRLLLQYGADPDYADRNGVTAMDYLYDDEAIELGFVRKSNSDAVEKMLLGSQGEDDAPPPPKPFLN